MYKYITNKKLELDSYRNNGSEQPFALKKDLEDWFRTEMTYTSNALGGSTLTRRETASILQDGLTIGGRSLMEHIRANNHADAVDWINNMAETADALPSEKQLLELHSLILRGVDDKNAGCYRTFSAQISDSSVTLPTPLQVPELMKQFIIWLRSYSDIHPVELAAGAHYRLLSIHPFAAGNGRTARLLMNLILIINGYPPVIISKRQKVSYINSLEKAHLGGSLDDYFKIVSKAVDRSLDIYLKAYKGKDFLPTENQDLVRIGVIASLSEESVPTIRYWTKEGLLNISDHTKSKYALYDSAVTLARIKEIQDFKKQRLTLNEIKEKSG